MASAERTVALLVGIDTYETRPDAELRAPVPDTIALAQWLASRRVPKPNVHLFLAPAAVNRPSLAALDGGPSGFLLHSAEQRVFRDFVLRQLPDLAGDVLVIAWAGHGIFAASDKESHRLFFADYPSHVDLNSLLLHLRRSADLKIDRLVCLVDACAADFDERTLVGPLTFPAGLDERGCQEFVLYAASPGEYAKEQGEERTGTFSAELRAALNLTAPDVWPPDLEAIADAVQKRFKELRAAGKASQTPVFWYRGPDRDWSSLPTMTRGGLRRKLEPAVFTNRKAELADLAKAARDRATRVLVIHGRAGIGKSTVAGGFLATLDFGSVSAWIGCAGASAEQLFTDMASGLGATTPDIGSSAHSLESRVRALLKAVGYPSYVVLDNLEVLLTPDGAFADPGVGTVLRAFLAFEHRIRLLITTRRLAGDIQAGVPGVYVSPLRGLSADGAAMLLASTPGLPPERVAAATEHPAFARLEGHPVFIRMLGTALLKLPEKVVLSRAVKNADIGGYVVREVIGQLDKRALSVLRAAAVFRDAFPFEALEHVVAATGGSVDELPVVLTRLLDDAVLDRAQQWGGYYVHPVLREAAGERTEYAALHASAATWYLWGPLDPHEPATWEPGLHHLHEAAVADPANQYQTLAAFMLEHGQKLDYAGYQRRLLDENRLLAEIAPPNEQWGWRMALGIALWSYGDYGTAEKVLGEIDEAVKEALAADENAHLADYDWVIAVKQKLGDIALRRGDLDRATQLAAEVEPLLPHADRHWRYRAAELRFG